MTQSNFKKTEHKLKNSGETPDLKAVIGDERDAGDVDVFGYQIIYTTGDFMLPREDLLDKMTELGFPTHAGYLDGEVPWMAPGRVQPHNAFTRAKDQLFTESDVLDGQDYREIPDWEGQRVVFDLESGSSHYEQHVHAKVYYDADDAGMTEGQYVDHELGVIKYDGDLPGPVFVDRVEEDDELFGAWVNGIKPRMEQLYETHRDYHTGDDVNNLVYYLARQWTDAIKLRDACYFVPAGYEFTAGGETRTLEDLIDSFRELYSWIDGEYKTQGQQTELFAIEIMDSTRQAEMVESKVRDELESEVDTVFDELVDDITDGVAVEEVAEDIVDSLGDVEGLAERHSAVLKTQLSVERAMDRVLEESSEDRQEIVEEALDEIGLSADGNEVSA